MFCLADRLGVTIDTVEMMTNEEFAEWGAYLAHLAAERRRQERRRG